ncbi:hypothetical protein FACS189491_11360 [Spirochaetia bacterium]|nr:hypothetical protein FACS189491_11360 [Spirochaetia bacterium]
MAAKYCTGSMLSVFLFTSCVLSPWKTLEFTDMELNDVPMISVSREDSRPDEQKYNKYYINDSFIVQAAILTFKNIQEMR